VSDKFVQLAGKNAEGVVCTYPWNPDRKDPKLDAFREAFKNRWGVEPDTYATHAYDGMNMLIWAIQNAGLNRAKIRDILAYRAEPFAGVTGDIPLSSYMDRASDAFLARYENGKCSYFSREDLGIPHGKVIETPRAEREQASAR
jgi:ABC-type branched-subunit amino acid transport system substrate-binding protein